MRLQTRYTASFLMVLFCRIEGVDGECVSSSSYGFFYGVYTAKCTVTYGIIFTVSLLSAAVCCATLYMSCSLSFSATPCSLLISIHCMFYALLSSSIFPNILLSPISAFTRYERLRINFAHLKQFSNSELAVEEGLKDPYVSVRSHTVRCSTLHYTVLYSTELYKTLHHTTPRCATLLHNTLHCTTLHYTRQIQSNI